MPIDMGNQFSGLPMADLIGGPLNAACDAQVRLATATATFIEQVGFIPPPSNSGSGTDPSSVTFDPDTFDVRNVAFKFSRPAQGAVPDPTTGVVPSENVELDVPLLAIVKIPALSIDLVDITFDMEVKNTETSKDSTDASASVTADTSVGWGPFSAKVSVTGSVATHKENTRSTDQSAKYHVQVTARDTGMPEGLSRVLDIMNSAVAPSKISSGTASGGGSGGGGTTGGGGSGGGGSASHDLRLDHDRDTANAPLSDSTVTLRPGRYVVEDELIAA